MKPYELAGFEVSYVNCRCLDIVTRKRRRLSP